MQGNSALMGLTGLMPFILIIVIFYFILIRPQMKKEKAMEKMRSEIKKGDNVVTSGGICGTVLDFKGDKVILRIDDRATLMVLRGAISGLQDLAAPPEAQPVK
ncbi:preprotein translocase subunit YajC [Candidatus Desantisbacteria bacterium CG_4_10_14_0_8_um_filter_48_22]|uniref:Preprotein translocase subunit YajC n=1 Tax=Candidatus Desantisbacteria bacterium CG_4_10_14_0_8_um_filter_48_22 TaxID=1974543 RepID=A0A2M7SEV7_9BACT|nr:MAG: preprotein translocase subunit YajC [Candidatus Desantisbacteria bacterium CG1_02_49_89]PIV55507.1 MAG: preprotein translocase subunit YajC [Candidatus Desantisbacteria bacterium CG02_land_8_20_14_3_00_49_13]PIZ18046.1 MAG: preprotein translocase subunit YajC [Candidatus Desantisbacteria bacterium CG_4_10_14_0_8_um_filter_48_22]PJB28051.1 MAG: preprotein translocase subunit YajC [Candidatus Desantisbacteria bacterium CG_4_9_14_3_um_filter_50_7]